MDVPPNPLAAPPLVPTIDARPAPDAPMVEHALYHASCGAAVFPVPLGSKKSHKSAERSGGRKWGATRAEGEIRSDFAKWPDANIGIVTGAKSEIFVVETDTAEGHGDGVDGGASLAALEAEHGALPATRQAESPSGSIHYYFNHPGFPIKNSVSAISPGIDVRGDGGMVLAPPSVKPGKGVYTWRNDLPIADAPQWLLDKIAAGKEEPEPESEPETELTMSQQALATVRPPSSLSAMADRPYIEAALRGEYDAVACIPSHLGQNDQLNISSMKLGHRVAAGLLSEQEVIDTMMAACAANGLLNETGRNACLATIESGLRFGKTEPKGIPQPKIDAARDNVIALPSVAMAFTLFDDVEDCPKKNWLMKGAIAKGETSLWIAPPGRLKSALMGDLAIHLASGKDWRGYKSKEKCGAVYFALERGDLVKRRLAAQRKRDGLTGLADSRCSRHHQPDEPEAALASSLRRSAALKRSLAAVSGLPRSTRLLRASRPVAAMRTRPRI